MRPRSPRSPCAAPLRVFAALTLFGVIASGCSDLKSPISPDDIATIDRADFGIELSVLNPRVRQIMSVQDGHTTSLMRITRVVGTATGLTSDEGSPSWFSPRNRLAGERSRRALTEIGRASCRERVYVLV